MADATKPNNKIANAYANNITSTLVGYFMGEPVSYAVQDDSLLEELNLLFEYNDEADENAELAKNASIFGVAYELLYMEQQDEGMGRPMLRFCALDPRECVPIYDETIAHNLIAFVRYYTNKDILTNKEILSVELITDKETKRYEATISGGLSLIEEIPHYFGAVPVAIFKNNEELMGDFEPVISLIDAYDTMESDTVNDFDYFVDAYLALYGFTADSEDIIKMKENRVLLMDEGTNAEWLIKNAPDTNVENMKIRLDKDIHKFSHCPDMNDENFAGNTSGVAIKYKLLGTENLVSIKERKFKKGLQQRLELISFAQGLMGADWDWRAIDIIFRRNIPADLNDIANIVNTLTGIVSNQTLLGQIPFVDDIEAEEDRLQAEQETKKMNNPFLRGLNLDYPVAEKETDE
jgi:SPP1 family phage portal protein